MQQHLDRYSTLRVFGHISLHDKYQSLVGQLLKLIDEKGRVRVSTLESELFPLHDDAAADNLISQLVQVINDAAESSGVQLTARITAYKNAGVISRWVWFQGSSQMPGPSHCENQNSIHPERLVVDQQGPVTGDPVIMLLTFNQHETQAVFKEFVQNQRVPVATASPYFELGRHGGARVMLRISRQGSAAAQQAAEESIRLFSPKALIGVGIAFGVDEQKQSIGDVLVSAAVNDYELRKVNKLGVVIPRGHTPPHRPCWLIASTG
ncbi:hypothetical protein AS189_09365 [Arthrobacter alpinus]|uniref:NACHT N-terminal Helical domain-containing protein n=1 Tax=Arthrobacter alpinus TaxID=656366 RepID=A0A0S2LZA4_9MICC|nr:hypothetical protein [Arthrobacter alpinus]ALO66662.1 hypothetical protein AS189_09365 [Arthrobacter alpinus]